LREALAKEHGIPVDWIYLTSGVDEAIRLATQAYGSSAHLFTPTEYTTFDQFCPRVQLHPSLVDLDYKIGVEPIAGASLIWLANPNNPVGFTTPEAILQLAQNNLHATVVVDEIYGEYAPHLSVISHITHTPNLVVCKGFSKAYGLAGIRLGYIIAKPEIITTLGQLSPWANVAYPSCGMAMIALKHREFYQQQRGAIVARKKRLSDWLAAKGATIVPSFINTVVIRFKSAAQASSVAQALAEQNILVNIGSNKKDKVGLGGNYISFVVGTDAQIGQFQHALQTALTTT
jgi:histidinol-phosphate aminotransferase